MIRNRGSLSIFASVMMLCGCATSHLPKITPVNTLTEVNTKSSGLSDYDRGKAQLVSGNSSLAIEVFRKDLVQSGPSIRTLNALAVAYSQLGRPDVAEQYFQEAFQLDRSAPETTYNYAMLKYQDGNFSEARQFFDLAASLSAGAAKPGESASLRKVVADAAARTSCQASEKLALIENPPPSDRGVQRSGATTWDLNLSNRESDAKPLATVADFVRPITVAIPDRIVEGPRPNAGSVERHSASALSKVKPAQPMASLPGDMPASRPAAQNREGTNSDVRLMAASVVSGAVTKSGTPHLRVVNGIGKAQMAHRIAAFLRKEGHLVNSLANAPSYDQQQSTIRYRPGFSESAAALAKQLSSRIRLVEVSGLRSEIEITLGKDLLDFDRALKTA